MVSLLKETEGIFEFMRKNNNQRSSERFKLAVPVQLKLPTNSTTPKNLWETTAMDISSTGAFVESDHPLEIGSELELNIDIPLTALKKLTGDRAKVTIKAKVVRNSLQGMGLSFDQFCEFQYMSEDQNLADNQEPLTQREQEILGKISQGASNKEISQELCISPHTVKTHLHNIFKKINVKGRLQAALWAASNLAEQEA